MKYSISVITVEALLKQKDHLLRPSHEDHLGEIFSSCFNVNLCLRTALAGLLGWYLKWGFTVSKCKDRREITCLC